MKLSRKSEYAFLALTDLARAWNEDKTLPASAIAEKNQIPKKFLDQILKELREGSYVESIRGVNGGYRLAKAPDQICLAEIIRLFDGAIAPIASVSTYFYTQTPSEQNEKLLACFKDIRDYTAKRLEAFSLDQLI